MQVVLDLDRGIYPQSDRDIDRFAVRLVDRQRDILSTLDTALDADQVEGLGTVEAKGLGADAVLELARQNAHADEVAAVDALEALGDDGADAEEARAFRGPVAGGAGAVLVSGEDDQRDAGGLILDRGIVDAELIAARLVNGHAALDAGDHQVLDADIGEGAAHHDAIVASAGTVAVEVLDGDAVLLQVQTGRRGRLDGAGG